jgi:DNA-binding LacI/PurR family transcriptional regulator
MRDVAEAAGVSTMAVSVVLNGTGGRNITVSPEKAERIRQAAKKLRYQPNRVASSFRNNKTKQVAVVFQHFGRLGQEHPYHTQVLNGVTAALFPQGYTLSLCPKMINEGDASSISDGRFDGVLWCRPDLTDTPVDDILNATTPVVMMHVPPGLVPGISSFCADNEGAMRRVVDHLKELGHERLAFVIDPLSVKSVEGEVRSQALINAAVRAGLPEPDVIVLPADHSILDQYKDADAPHTALVCFSDELAGFVLESCARQGISVPGDVSIVGFDSSPFCETTKPRLTSVYQPVEHIAFAATNHLLALIQEAEGGRPRSPAAFCLYDCGLDIRDSTAPPRAR